MSITFVPQRGLILICDFDMAGVVPPEMRKKRRVVVVSPRSHNRRHDDGPGRCIVVPFSASLPTILTAAEVPFLPGVYRSLTAPTWAIFSAAESVFHARLDRVAAGSVFISERLSDTDRLRLEAGSGTPWALPNDAPGRIFQVYPEGDLRGPERSGPKQGRWSNPAALLFGLSHREAVPRRFCHSLAEVHQNRDTPGADLLGPALRLRRQRQPPTTAGLYQRERAESAALGDR